ncbi:M26 family metallopeptidase [[Clostridium] polysaccharolyticum]|uniref:The GLUG motif-containing protein n=1 Tax=[Clostridium] polysaccharolyticum TaxID=29364 RepID=A0A1H9ZUP1_9FIRM|nr:hypothetical protein [[Clostridium] polysaccharolyticum]SES85427.1 hypothetical protein SAMN04487772_104123 [[Clostridium] polysaccharolyticum]
MNTKSKQMPSRFAGYNSGIIADCHAFVSCKKKSATFCNENKGTLERSFPIDHPCPKQDYILSPSQPEDPVLSIHTKEDLLLLREKVNAGDNTYQNGTFLLMEDIDLSGISWIPIGASEGTPFQGTFLGNGHAIHNLSVQQKEPVAAGLFGYISHAAITNLVLSGHVKGKMEAGLLTGVANESTITNCYVTGSVFGRQATGMFAGYNTGEIRNCYAEGKLLAKTRMLPVVLSSAASLLVIGTIAILFHHKKLNTPDYFPPIPVDTSVTRIDHKKSKTGKNSISCDFATELVSNKNGMTRIDFRNPGESNHHAVIQLQIPDSELNARLGKTGRTKKEQSKLDHLKAYNPDTYRVIVAESGSIPPGFSLPSIPLKKLPDGTELPKGTYHAIVYLSFYNIATNSEAMVHTQSPVTLVIR